MIRVPLPHVVLPRTDAIHERMTVEDQPLTEERRAATRAQSNGGKKDSLGETHPEH